MKEEEKKEGNSNRDGKERAESNKEGRKVEKGRALVHVKIARPLTILCYYACPFLLHGATSTRECSNRCRPSWSIRLRKEKCNRDRDGEKKNRVAFRVQRVLESSSSPIARFDLTSQIK